MLRFLALTAAASLALLAQSPKGTLVIAGGGRLPPPVFEAFVAAAGGKGARIAVLPAASGVPREAAQAIVDVIERLGAKAVVIHPTDRTESEAGWVLEAAKGCTGFWFTGGDQNRIVDTIGGTALHRLVLQKYQEGSAIGGTSAGAAIMSRIMLVGTDDVSETAPGTYRTRDGLGFLPGCIVDQHFLRRSRHNRLLSLVMEHPDHLALGVDEETALVVKGGLARVVGNRTVIVLDPARMKARKGGFTGLLVHLLVPGQGLDLPTRTVQDDALPMVSTGDRPPATPR